MKTILRSLFVAGQDNPKEIHANMLACDQAGFSFDGDEDAKIHKYIKAFVQDQGHPPDIGVIKAHFQHRREPEVLDRLEILIAIPAVFKGNFEKRLEQRITQRKTVLTEGYLRDAATIMQVGLEIKEGRESKMLLGPEDAMRYLNDHAHEILVPMFSGGLYGEVTKDGEAFMEEYRQREQNPLAGIGQFIGLRQADEGLKGAKRYELWTHAAFTGGLKSTLCYNWVYTQSVYYGHSSVVFSLEMPYSQVRKLLFSMHSMHHKFTEVRIKLGLQTDPKVAVGVPYEAIRDGTMTDAQKMFMEHFVVKDLEDPANGYGKIHIEVADPNKSDFTVMDARTRAEVIHQKSPFKLIAFDHMGLMSPRKWVPSVTDRLNEIVRDMKRLAMNFNRGQGIAVLNLSQLSREGFRAALKREEQEKQKGNPPSGRYYNLTHLSYSNEIERSSDIVTTTYLNDDMRKAGRVWFQCLKARDQRPIDPFQARIEWPCMRLFTLAELPTGMTPQELGDELDG